MSFHYKFLIDMKMKYMKHTTSIEIFWMTVVWKVLMRKTAALS